MNAELQEIEILRQRLTEAEAEIARAKTVIKAQAGAIMDVDVKTYHCMKQLLTANDVFRESIGHELMRTSVLEILNDLRRYARRRFETAGIVATVEPAPNEEQPDASDGQSFRGQQKVISADRTLQ